MAEKKATTLTQLKNALLCCASSVASAALEAVRDLDSRKADKPVRAAVTIPTTGWRTDNTVPSHPIYMDIAVTGLSSTDIVNVNVAPASAMAASAAEFTNTQSYSGYFRLRCKNVPATAISAEYHIINTTEYSV